MADNLALPYKRYRVLTIDGLPDDVLLEIFDFYVVRYEDLALREPSDYIIDLLRTRMDSWQSLVHVCRRWRGLVFGSPRRLNLQICYFIPSRLARKSLDVWPALPILISGTVYNDLESVDEVISVLEHIDRISHIILVIITLPNQIEKLWAAMRVPFPELVALYLSFTYFSCVPVLSDSFLGGSAPRLRHFYLDCIPFRGLPNLLLSVTHLVHLRLLNTPYFGYTSPEAMAPCLSMLTSLETLQLYFLSSQPFPDQENRRPFPPTRSVLHSLTTFSFKGVKRYLDEFVSRIDAPQLSSTMFFDDIDFDTPELKQFISRMPTLGEYDEARFIFHGIEALVRLRQTHPEGSDHRMVEVKSWGHRPDRQLSTLGQICTLSLRPRLTMMNLYIDGKESSPLDWADGVEFENTKWLDLLLPFTAVKNLYLSKQISPLIALALQELTGERTTEVLPALQNVFLEGFQPSEPVHEGIAQFISARQLTNHPVAISAWDNLEGNKS